MPWREPKTVPLTRIGVVAQIPSESGVYAIFEDENCLLVGEAWNLKARLLELLNVLQDVGEFRVTFDICSEDLRTAHKNELAASLLTRPAHANVRVKELPGISFWDGVPR